MADNKNRQALSNDSLDEVSGGYMQDLGNGVVGVFDNDTEHLLKTFHPESRTYLQSDAINKMDRETWEKANQFDNEYHAAKYNDSKRL